MPGLVTAMQSGDVKPWFGAAPRREPPVVEGFELLSHERVDMLQLSIAGLVLLPVWGFIFVRVVTALGGRESFDVHLTALNLIGGALIALAGVPLIHELVHGMTARALGARPAYGVGPGFAYTTFPEPMNRTAYIIVGLAPLVIISVVGAAIAVWVDALAGWLVFACIVNASGAIGDLWMAWRVARLPRGAICYDLADGFAAFVPAQHLSQQPSSHRRSTMG